MTHALEDRKLFRLTGKDVRDFLQGLISNDIAKAEGALVYAALLNPQGKYLADFFLTRDADGYVLDAAGAQAAGLVQRLGMYKLRADVQIVPLDRGVAALAEEVPGALRDPRDPGMGWRLIGGEAGMDRAEYDARRVAHIVPESGIELIPNESYLLEAGFERLSGVDFRKGCYVGQEVTARMKHKTELRKGLALVSVQGVAPPVGTEILAEGRAAGTLYTVAGGRAIAYLRYDRAGGVMQAGEAEIRRVV